MYQKSSIKNASVQNNNTVVTPWLFFFLVFLLGKQIGKGSGLNELLNIHNSAKVVNVKDPEPGTWTIKVKFLQKSFITCLIA